MNIQKEESSIHDIAFCGDFLRLWEDFLMGERYTRYSTANDVMKEFLIYGAELTEIIKRER